jgi:hypothetical protein
MPTELDENSVMQDTPKARKAKVKGSDEESESESDDSS